MCLYAHHEWSYPQRPETEDVSGAGVRGIGHLNWVLETKLRFSVRGVGTVNHYVITLARITTLTPLVLNLHFYSQ